MQQKRSLACISLNQAMSFIQKEEEFREIMCTEEKTRPLSCLFSPSVWLEEGEEKNKWPWKRFYREKFEIRLRRPEFYSWSCYDQVV